MRRTLTALWSSDRPLTFVGLFMVAALVLSLAGVWIDHRVITGMPAWMKPAKFAASIAIYCLTLAWIFSYLPEWRKTRRVVSIVSSAVFMIELAVIDLQAWRGTTSHFNVGTALDGALFSVMGVSIMIQTVTSVAVAVALWRQAFADRALGWALRLGFTLSILGASSGGLMVPPRADQLAEARATHHMSFAGSHTIGAPDGSPGGPGTGWSTQHGDLRVGHFVGLHAVQALLLLLFVFRGRVPAVKQTYWIIATAACYAALFAILLWQALRGISFFAPDQPSLIALAAWAVCTLAISIWAVADPTSPISTRAGGATGAGAGMSAERAGTSGEGGRG